MNVNDEERKHITGFSGSWIGWRPRARRKRRAAAYLGQRRRSGRRQPTLALPSEEERPPVAAAAVRACFMCSSGDPRSRPSTGSRSRRLPSDGERQGAKPVAEDGSLQQEVGGGGEWCLRQEDWGWVRGRRIGRGSFVRRPLTSQVPSGSERHRVLERLVSYFRGA